jgi:3-oxoacyl-[acyl-carrier-protein] synthase II
MKNNQPVITNMALATPIGNNIEEVFNNAINGVSGIKKITDYDVSQFHTQIGGMVKFEKFRKEHFLSDKNTHLAKFHQTQSETGVLIQYCNLHL